MKYIFTNSKNFMSPRKCYYLRKKLLEWYHTNGRHFPWRKTKNAYNILIAEILLQQTDAPKVAKEYKSFVKLFDTPKKLSHAKTATVHRFIKKLGLDYRVDRLINLARSIEKKFNGLVPNTEEGLLSLPGVGKYIANAVLSSAYDKRVAILDTNIIRIIERFFGIKSTKPRPHTDPKLWVVAEQLLPRKTNMCKIWNYALLDFGALICSHYNPKCEECPCRHKCSYLND